MLKELEGLRHLPNTLDLLLFLNFFCRVQIGNFCKISCRRLPAVLDLDKTFF